MTPRHRVTHSRPPFPVLVAGVFVLAAVSTLVAASVTGARAPDRPAASHPAVSASRAATAPPRRVGAAAPWLAPVPPGTAGHLRPGSDPSVLPSDLLIADKLNNRLIVVDPQGRLRWQFPRPGDLAPGQTFRIPDDAFFSPDGRQIIATEEDDAVVTVIDVATHRIVYRYGHPGRPGSAAGYLSNPDDAMLLTPHKIIVADIKNCRLLVIVPPAHAPERVIGRTTTSCLHAPPQRWGSPNGMFPLPGGGFLVTEINGDWVDAVSPTGAVAWTTHPPGVAYPSDTNQIAPDRFLTADYSSPGQAVIFDRAGHLLWRFRGRGADTLNHPSLALPLPNGDIILNDDLNHRVVVIDPHTDTIVWQYGVTGVAGHRPGYLDNPDGIDLVPPHSLLSSGAAAAPGSAQPAARPPTGPD